MVDVLHTLGSTHPAVLDAAWIEPFRRSAIKGEDEPWAAVLRERLQEWASLDANGVELARRSVELPPELFENHDACEAVRRAAAAETAWPMLGMGKGAAKALVSNIKLDGASMWEEDRTVA